MSRLGNSLFAAAYLAVIAESGVSLVYSDELTRRMVYIPTESEQIFFALENRLEEISEEYDCVPSYLSEKEHSSLLREEESFLMKRRAQILQEPGIEDFVSDYQNKKVKLFCAYVGLIVFSLPLLANHLLKIND